MSIAKVVSLSPNEQIESGDTIEIVKVAGLVPEEKTKPAAEALAKKPLSFPLKATIYPKKVHLLGAL